MHGVVGGGGPDEPRWESRYVAGVNTSDEIVNEWTGAGLQKGEPVAIGFDRE